MRPGFVLVRLRGGLGNQMFQCAFGRMLSIKHSCELLVDCDLLIRPHATPRSYALGAFALAPRQASLRELRVKSNIIISILEGRPGFHRHALDFHAAGASISLDGYWQSERYFHEIGDQLRRDFSFQQPVATPAPLMNKIRQTCAVCVHVRRTDYLDPSRSKLSVLDIAYYRRAIERLAAELENPHFFVFSDDIKWCVQNLKCDAPHTFVSNSDRNDPTWGDFHLMTLCRHFIIANSTFSWWAAWLGNHPAKRVIVTADWFPGNPTASADIIPGGWSAIRSE